MERLTSCQHMAREDIPHTKTPLSHQELELAIIRGGGGGGGGKVFVSSMVLWSG